jgi:hypothetical protein
MLYRDHAALARGVLEVIDDIAQLNRLQEQAFAACKEKFDWSSRGRQLVAAVSA